MKHVQWIGHGLAEADAYVGASREITVVTDTGELRVHDGATPGGRQIPTSDQIAGFDSLRFNGTASYGAPGEIAAADQGKLVKLTLAGTYDIPELADIVNIGGTTTYKAMVSGVILECQSTDQIENGVNNVTTINLVEGELIELSKFSAALYLVTNRYVP